MEITVKTNNNGILEGTAKSTEADGTINPEIPVKMNIRSDGFLVVKNMDGTPYKGLVIKKLSDIAEIEVRPAANKAKEKPKTEEPAPKEKPAELTERQRLQKENAEANSEFDRLVNSPGGVDPKLLEAARTRKRNAAAALEKYLSSDTAAKKQEPEAPKIEPKKAPEAQKIAPEVSQEMALAIKDFTK